MAYLNTEQIAWRYGFVKRENGQEVADRNGVRDYLDDHGIPTTRRGRTVLVDERDLDASLTAGRPPSMAFARAKHAHSSRHSRRRTA
jgi:hypothetical protein